MKPRLWISAFAGAAAIALAIPLVSAQEELTMDPPASESFPQADLQTFDDCQCDACDATGVAHPRRRGAVHAHRGHLRPGGLHLGAALAAGSHSGQPLIDPWMKADWIAQQRAATMSWHAGYYHTQWGAPVAQVVPPTARTHTRWGWGVAQTTVQPLYHQFKRPYPGPVFAEAGMASPLLPTPRWPSHTDQFGVYYVRGPW